MYEWVYADRAFHLFNERGKRVEILSRRATEGFWNTTSEHGVYKTLEAAQQVVEQKFGVQTGQTLVDAPKEVAK